jgi:hypothetical protein
MIRRQFIRRTLGVIAGAVCAPFVGMAAEAVSVPSQNFHVVAYYPKDTINFIGGYVNVVEGDASDTVCFSWPLTQEQRDGR